MHGLSAVPSLLPLLLLLSPAVWLWGPVPAAPPGEVPGTGVDTTLHGQVPCLVCMLPTRLPGLRLCAYSAYLLCSHARSIVPLDLPYTSSKLKLWRISRPQKKSFKCRTLEWLHSFHVLLLTLSLCMECILFLCYVKFLHTEIIEPEPEASENV